MNDQHKKENDRAARIAFMTNGYHESISRIYEQVVDREYESAKEQIKSLMKDLRELSKDIDNDNF